MSKFLGVVTLWTVVVLTGNIAAAEHAASRAVADAHEEYVAAMAAATEEFQRAVNRAHKRYLTRLRAAAVRGDALSGGSLATAGIHQHTGKPKKQRVSVDWSEIYRQSARVRVLEIEPVLLTASEESGWQRVPPALQKRPALIYSEREDTYNGVADIDVTRDGILLVACNYGYQGNQGGDWDEKRWSKEDFIENGWTPISDEELGGVLALKGGREQIVFMKHVKKGENYRLRCNKYDPPFAIVFP